MRPSGALSADTSKNTFIPQKVFINSFCISQFPHKFVNLVTIKDKLTDVYVD